MTNTLIVGNGGSNLNSPGVFNDGGNNLLTGTAADAKLGTLADNGGPTQTVALLPGSPAIDAGNTTLATDQRGVTRPQGSAADIGAFELFQNNAPTDIALSNASIAENQPAGTLVGTLSTPRRRRERQLHLRARVGRGRYRQRLVRH